MFIATVGNSRSCETLGKIVVHIRRGAVVCLSKLSACVRLARARMLNLARAERTSGGDLAAVSVGSGRFGGGGRAGHSLSTWNIKNIQFAASGRFSGKILGWIVGDMVAIDNVVVPISGSELQSVGSLEAKGAFPRSGLSVPHNGEWQLILVSIPGAKEMNSLDVRRRAKSERELNGRARHVVG